MLDLSSLGPAPQLGYCDSPLDRAAMRRADPAFLAKLAQRADAGIYLVGGESVLLKKSAAGLDPLFAPHEADDLAGPGERVFLGLSGDSGRFAAGLAPLAVENLKASADLQVSDLRSIAVRGLVAPEHLPPLAEAKALLHWHARRHFCSNCGAASVSVLGGWRRDCPACGMQHFPRTDPVVIMLAVDGEDCLMGRQAHFAPGMWSALAGFVEPGETMEEAVRREIFEESGVRCGAVRYFASQPWPFPSSLMIGCHVRALSRALTVDKSELEDARWFNRAEAAAMLAGRHPQGLTTPPPVAIAHHIIRAFVTEPARLFGG